MVQSQTTSTRAIPFYCKHLALVFQLASILDFSNPSMYQYYKILPLTQFQLQIFNGMNVCVPHRIMAE